MKALWIYLLITLIHIQGIGQDQNLAERKFKFSQGKVRASALLGHIGTVLETNISYNSRYFKDRELDIGTDSVSLSSILSLIFQRDSVPFKVIGTQLAIYDLDQIPINCHKSNYGRLTDLLTNHGLEHVNIIEMQTGFKTVSNQDGQFRIDIPCSYDSIHLFISTPGYRHIYVKEAVGADIGQLMLEGTYVSLQEIVVRGVPAEDIMIRSFDRIDENYLDQESNADAFFREAIFRNKKLAKLSEGAFRVHNQPYATMKKGTDRFRIRKSRRIVNRSLLDTLEFKIKGSLRSCLELDIVKNRPAFYAGTTSLEHYDYHYKDMVTDGESLQYVVGFVRRPRSSNMPYKGQMNIDTETLAVTSVTFELDAKQLKRLANPFVIKANRGYRAKLKSANYFVSYTEVEGRMGLNYVSLETEYKVRKGKGPFSIKYETQSELLMHSHVLEDVRKIDRTAAFKLDQVFLDQPLILDNYYWEGFGAIPLESSLLKASKMLRMSD